VHGFGFAIQQTYTPILGSLKKMASIAMPSGNTLHRNFTYSRDNGCESPKAMMTQVLDNGLRQQAISLGRATLRERPAGSVASQSVPIPFLGSLLSTPVALALYHIPVCSFILDLVDNSLLHGRVRHRRVELHFLPMELQMLTFWGKMSSSKPTLDETTDDTACADALSPIKVCIPLGAFQSLPAPSCLQVSVCRCRCRC
jgi:hypothetical protein